MNEIERKEILAEIALRMYTAGLGWNYGALERLTRPKISNITKFLTLIRPIYAKKRRTFKYKM